MTHLSPDLGMLSTQGAGVKVQAKRSMNCEGARVTGVVDEYRNPQLLARVASENRNTILYLDRWRQKESLCVAVHRLQHFLFSSP
jgi:hypothetical protein